VAFATTHWTAVLGAHTTSDDAVSAAWDHLCQTYWPPLYGYLRQRGHPPADAEDLVQGFFAGLLERDSLRQVDRQRGRFRSFLLASLAHYAANVRRNATTQRRGGGRLQLNLDAPGMLEQCEAALCIHPTPEIVFDRLWARTVLTQAARRLREEFAARGKAATYEALREWLGREAGPGDYARAAAALGLTEGALAAAICRLRQRFRELIRQEVAQTVQSPAEIDGEMQYLCRILTNP
jgi:RNA polymerase sigma-70 factor (ECF subfamily)